MQYLLLINNGKRNTHAIEGGKPELLEMLVAHMKELHMDELQGSKFTIYRVERLKEL
jgi:hypothetical protein